MTFEAPKQQRTVVRLDCPKVTQTTDNTFKNLRRHLSLRAFFIFISQRTYLTKHARGTAAHNEPRFKQDQTSAAKSHHQPMQLRMPVVHSRQPSPHAGGALAGIRTLKCYLTYSDVDLIELYCMRFRNHDKFWKDPRQRDSF